jgi:thiamine transport system ATP-binding protein
MIRFEKVHYHSDGFRLTADFSVTQGRFIAVLGPSGAGKSTLLNLVAGFETVESGRLWLGETDSTFTAPVERPVSLVFQDHNCFAHLDAWSNVALGVSPKLKLHAAQVAAVDEALAAVGISHLRQRKPGEMSGGEQQRVAIARVLVRQRPILLLDEAFAALGPALRRSMLALVADLHRARALTTLMVTHQPEDARAVASEVVFIDGGLARAPVATEGFFASDDASIRAYLGDWS